MSPLRLQIAREIKEHGPIPFSRYMQICLYDPQYGYYSRNAEQFGKAGDFYTSSDIYAVFGRLLARQFEEIWRVLDRPPKIEILELGPGRGFFARDVLNWSKKKFPDFFAALTYTLQESSVSIGKKLEENLIDHLASGKAQIKSTARIEEKVRGEGEREDGVEGEVEEVAVEEQEEEQEEVAEEGKVAEEEFAEEEFADEVKVEREVDGNARVPKERPNLAQRGSAGTDATQNEVPEGRPINPSSHNQTKIPSIVFANELFDALPVEIVSARGKLHLDIKHDRLCEIWLQPKPEELAFLDCYGVHPEPNERIEVPLVAQKLMRDLATEIDRGVLMAIDYGYTRDQQLAGRHRGTLMTYRNHSASTDAYHAPGEQDITAHVNFTALAAMCEASGMRCESLLTQAQFLMGIGQRNEFADVFEECRLPQEKAKRALQLKHLLNPEGMGATFQVFIASRNIKSATMASLVGLSFRSNE